MKIIINTMVLLFLIGNTNVLALKTNSLHTNLFKAGIAEQDNYQYTVLEVTQSSSGRVKLELHISTESEDYYKDITVETTKQGALKIVGKDGKTKVINTEVDALNYLGKQGWEIVYMYQLTVLGNNVIKYIFEKKKN